MIVHVRFIGSPLRHNALTNLDTTGHGLAKTKSLQPGRQPIVFTPPQHIPETVVLIYADRRVRPILPSSETQPADWRFGNPEVTIFLALTSGSPISVIQTQSPSRQGGPHAC